jgi:FKBP-type peptidyl-prolyl cis-trans isomerase
MFRFIPIFIFFFLTSCSEPPQAPKKHQLTKDEVNNLSVQMGAWEGTKEKDEIDQYVKRHQWEMQQTVSGLRYMLLKQGDGELAKNGQTAHVYYKISLLDGTVCYDSKTDGAKDFVIGKDYVEAGLHEGIQLMHVGDKMRFILPSNLAHGLTGDQKKIPPFSVVVYEIELLSLKGDNGKPEVIK